MSKIVYLTEEQKKLLKDATETADQSMIQAQMMVDLANTKRKALNDLITMFCISNGLAKEKVKIDPVAGTATEETA